MKIIVDGELVLELTETQKRVIRDKIPDDIFDEDMKRRVAYILTYKYEQCFRMLKEEWDPKLKANGVKSIPLDEEEYAKLVFSQPNYKSRKQRDSVI